MVGTPEDEPYLWRHLSRHLRRAGPGDELNETVCGPRWVLAVLERHGGPGPLGNRPRQGFQPAGR